MGCGWQVEEGNYVLFCASSDRSAGSFVWDAVTQQRAASDAWRQSGLDPVLTGHEWNGDPFGGADTRDSTTPAIIWTHPSGARIESADPSFDPRTPQDQGWQRVR